MGRGQSAHEVGHDRLADAGPASRSIGSAIAVPRSEARAWRPDEDAKSLREELEAHIGKPASYGLPQNSDAGRGAYTKEEARQWIAEYKTALSAVSGGGRCPMNKSNYS